MRIKKWCGRTRWRRQGLIARPCYALWTRSRRGAPIKGHTATDVGLFSMGAQSPHTAKKKRNGPPRETGRRRLFFCFGFWEGGCVFVAERSPRSRGPALDMACFESFFFAYAATQAKEGHGKGARKKRARCRGGAKNARAADSRGDGARAAQAHRDGDISIQGHEQRPAQKDSGPPHRQTTQKATSKGHTRPDPAHGGEYAPRSRKPAPPRGKLGCRARATPPLSPLN